MNDSVTPTWDEMNAVRHLFFRDDETVMQLHVPTTDHISFHDGCLHLWRPQSQDEIEAIRRRWGDEWQWGDVKSDGPIPRPPSFMV